MAFSDQIIQWISQFPFGFIDHEGERADVPQPAPRGRHGDDVDGDRFQKLVDAIAALKKAEEATKKTDAAYTPLAGALKAFESGALGRTEGYAPLLRALARVTVEGVWLTRIQLAEGTGELSLTGELRAVRGALVVSLVAEAFIQREMAVWAERFAIPTNAAIDARLILGAAIFGVGWGLCGVCPGPAIAGLGTGNWSLLWALCGIALGAWLQGVRAKAEA